VPPEVLRRASATGRTSGHTAAAAKDGVSSSVRCELKRDVANPQPRPTHLVARPPLPLRGIDAARTGAVQPDTTPSPP